jgi:hypothetical protein
MGESTMGESIFRTEGGRYLASEHASGPWDPRALHGGAPAALITEVLERAHEGTDLAIARLGFELLRPVPFGPLEVSSELLRRGRRVQELAAELRCEGELLCRASALRVRPVPEGLPSPAGSGGERADGSMPPPEAGTPVRFALDDAERPSFAASGMEMRWLDDPEAPGPARVWMRLRHPLLRGEEPTPLARLVASADFGNGVSAALPFESFVFINADLSIHLHRQPQGEWIGLDSRTRLHPGGTGLAETVLHDLHGTVGRSFQTLVVEPR